MRASVCASTSSRTLGCHLSLIQFASSFIQFASSFIQFANSFIQFASCLLQFSLSRSAFQTPILLIVHFCFQDKRRRNKQQRCCLILRRQIIMFSLSWSALKTPNIFNLQGFSDTPSVVSKKKTDASTRAVPQRKHKMNPPFCQNCGIMRAWPYR